MTRHGKPVLAIMTWELFESLSKTIDILSDSELMDQIRKGMKAIEEGRTPPWEEVKAELDLWRSGTVNHDQLLSTGA